MKSHKKVQHLAAAVSETQKAVLNLAGCKDMEIIRSLPRSDTPQISLLIQIRNGTWTSIFYTDLVKKHFYIHM